MRCEMCTRRLGSREIAHGIRYGTSDPESDLFIPSKESAYTVICQACGESILRQIYSRLNKSTAPKYQVDCVKSCMKDRDIEMETVRR